MLTSTDRFVPNFKQETTAFNLIKAVHGLLDTLCSLFEYIERYYLSNLLDKTGHIEREEYIRLFTLR